MREISYARASTGLDSEESRSYQSAVARVYLARLFRPRTPYLMLLSRYPRELSIQAYLRLTWRGAIVEAGAIELNRIYKMDYKMGKLERVKLYC